LSRRYLDLYARISNLFASCAISRPADEPRAFGPHRTMDPPRWSSALLVFRGFFGRGFFSRRLLWHRLFR
jgi:hypothetical protein